MKARFPYFEYFEEIWGASEDKYSPSTSIVHHLRLPGTSKEDSSISGTSSVIKQEAADTESVIDSMPLEFNFEENSAFDGAMPEVESDPLSEHETAETSSSKLKQV